MNLVDKVHCSDTYLSLVTLLTVRAIRLIVQLLGDDAEELRLIFVSVVVRRAYTDQLEDKNK